MPSTGVRIAGSMSTQITVGTCKFRLSLAYVWYTHVKKGNLGKAMNRANAAEYVVIFPDIH